MAILLILKISVLRCFSGWGYSPKIFDLLYFSFTSYALGNILEILTWCTGDEFARNCHCEGTITGIREIFSANRISTEDHDDERVYIIYVSALERVREIWGM